MKTKNQKTAIGNRGVIEQTRTQDGRWHYKVFQKVQLPLMSLYVPFLCLNTLLNEA